MEREKKIIRTSFIGILVNIILVLFKTIIGVIANSIAIVLDAVNNLTDVISSVVTIIGTKIANKAPDREHPFGHGRVEYVTSVIVSSIILFAGITALEESIDKIVHPQETNYNVLFLAMIAIGVVVKFILGNFVKARGRKYNSQSLIASGEDALMDCIVSFSTLVAAIVNFVLNKNIEGYIGIFISVVIIRSAIEILRDTIDLMIGQRAEKSLTDKIKKEISEYNQVKGVYDLAIHTYGPTKTIGTVHIQIPDDMTANEIHVLTRKITVDLFNKFGIFMTIGIYAANDSGEFGELRGFIAKTIKDYSFIKQIHGFFVDKENNDVYFDLIFDFDCKNREEVREEIVAKLKEKYPEYKFYIIIDDDITD